MHRFLDFQLRQELKLWPLALSQTFRGIAVSLLTLFSSLYIYKTIISSTDNQKTALIAVFVYFLTVYLLKFLANLLAEELALKLGLKLQLYLGLGFFATCIALLFVSQWRTSLIFWAAPFWGLATGFYWFGSHGMMVKMGKLGDFGKESGLINLVTTLPLVAVPVLGGAIISLAGYPTLFGFSLFFVALSALSIYQMKEYKTHQDTDVKEVFRLFLTHKRMVLAYMGDMTAAVIYTIVIPLYLYLILKKEISIGEFFSLSMTLVAVLNLLIGRWADVRGDRGLIVYGSIVQALVWFSRIFGKGVGLLFSLDIADRVTDSMIAIPMQAWTYKKALLGRSTGRAVLFRELAITLGGILTCLFLIILTLVSFDFRVVFLVAALASFFPIFTMTLKRFRFPIPEAVFRFFKL